MEIARPMPFTPFIVAWTTRSLSRQPESESRWASPFAAMRPCICQSPGHAPVMLAFSLLPLFCSFYYTQMRTIALSGSLLHSRGISNMLFINLYTLTFA